MFIPTDSPTGHFTLLPMPREFFETPPPFGGGALLVLNKFANNSASLRAEHMVGIRIAAAQAAATFGPSTGSLEVYGLTDRTGSEQLNKDLSGRRARAALEALRAAMGLGDFRATFANGLGERFAAEYFELADNSRDDMFRGVACYLWESFTMARDPILRLEISFATPPTGGSPRRRVFLAALHMGRLRAQPASPFA
jgi:OmpA family